MGRNRRPKVLSLDELKTKGTRELLGYLGKLHKCEASYDKSDMDSNPDLLNDGYIYFKETAQWKAAHTNVKTILAEREHIA